MQGECPCGLYVCRLLYHSVRGYAHYGTLAWEFAGIDEAVYWDLGVDLCGLCVMSVEGG